MSKARVCGKNADSSNAEESPENPAIMRFLDRRVTTFSTNQPVDTFNSLIPDPNEYPEIGRKGSKKPHTFVRRKAVDYQLRSAFDVLKMESLQDENLALRFATINLSDKHSKRYIEQGATEYGVNLTKRFKRSLPDTPAEQMPRFIAVLESSANRTLHAHLIILFRIEDEAKIKDILYKEAKYHTSSVSLTDTYRRWLDAEPGSEKWELNELDIETFPQDCRYRHIGVNPAGEKRFYGVWELDTGAVDYMSKEIHIPLPGGMNTKKSYIDKVTKMRAKQYYDKVINYAKGIKKSGRD